MVCGLWLYRMQVPGVLSVSVNLATNTAAIAYDPAVTGPRSCLEAVEAAGFEASLANTGATGT
jgi:Cu+-exporting ATPase